MNGSYADGFYVRAFAVSTITSRFSVFTGTSTGGVESIVTTYDDDNDNKSKREEYNKEHGSGWVLSIKSILWSRCFEIAKLINLFCEQMRDGGDG